MSFGQWSVCSAMFTGYFSATTWANSASATAPVTMSFTPVPEANSAPPVETWMMPSLPASAKPLIAAFTVSDEVTLIAGYAKPVGLRPVEHLGVDLGGGDGHVRPPLRRHSGGRAPRE